MTGCSLQVIQRIILGCQVQIHLVADISFQLYGFDLVSDFVGGENEDRYAGKHSALAPQREPKITGVFLLHPENAVGESYIRHAVQGFFCLFQILRMDKAVYGGTFRLLL